MTRRLPVSGKRSEKRRENIVKSGKMTRRMSVSGKASEKRRVGKWINTDHYFRNKK